MDDGAAWLQRLRHDLVKRMVWPARDRRDMGGAPAPGELVANLIDDEGRAADAQTVWRHLRTLAPDHVAANALDGFAQAIQRAQVAAAAGDVAGVLTLDAAWEALAQSVNQAK